MWWKSTQQPYVNAFLVTTKDWCRRMRLQDSGMTQASALATSNACVNRPEAFRGASAVRAQALPLQASMCPPSSNTLAARSPLINQRWRAGLSAP